MRETTQTQVNTVVEKDTLCFETTSHLFIGPLQKSKSDPCFHCFLTALKANNSEYVFIIENESRKKELQNDLILQDMESLIGKVYIINKWTGNVEEKFIHKHPFCPQCGTEEIVRDEEIEQIELPLGPDGRAFRLHDVVEKLKKKEQLLIDKDVGIGRQLFRDAESDVIPMYCVEARLNNRVYHSYGRSDQVKSAKYSAIFEMIERHASMVPQFKRKIQRDYHSLIREGNDVINPQLFIMNQNVDPEFAYSDDKSYFWTVCHRLDTNQPVYLPEQIVYYDNQLLRGEKRFIYETSNGTALGSTMNEAILFGLFELIERDHFLVHWYTKKLPKLIDQESIHDPNIHLMLKQLNHRGYKVFLFDITLDLQIPAVWVFAVNEKKEANLKYYTAAGCHYHAEKAIFSGLVEVASSVMVYEKILANEKKNFTHLIGRPEAVRTMEDHVNYYAFEENGTAFDFIMDQLHCLKKITTKEMQPPFSFDFATIKEIVLSKHPDVFVANMNNPVTRQLGFHVVKLLIPSLQPMTFGLQNERLNHTRISQFCEEVRSSFHRLEPHPFP